MGSASMVTTTAMASACMHAISAAHVLPVHPALNRHRLFHCLLLHCRGSSSVNKGALSLLGIREHDAFNEACQCVGLAMHTMNVSLGVGVLVLVCHELQHVGQFAKVRVVTQCLGNA